MKIKLNGNDIKANYTEELLKQRGIEIPNDLLNPTEEMLQEPFVLENIEKGYELFMNSLGKKPIALVVDCDCDGMTSAAVIYQYIKEVSPQTEIEYYIHEGKQHGLEDTYERIIDKDYELVLLPDAGTNDIEYQKILNEKGTPILVLDHHLKEEETFEEIPNTIIINNQCSPQYKNKDLTGVGVTWQFCRFCDIMNHTNYADKYIDLVALGVAGDMGSALSYENQYIFSKGFKNINNYFFKVLCDKQAYSMQNTVNYISVAFYIVPLINAMIRMGTMPEKERLFLSFIDGTRLVPSNKRGAKGTMEKVAVESARECTNAKSHQNKVRDTMVEKLSFKIEKDSLLDNKVLFIKLDDTDVFPAELNGLIAMMCTTLYKRPTIVARVNDEGLVRGSIRGLSNSEFDNFKGFLDESGFFNFVRGHAQAAGMEIPEVSIEKFHEYANKALENYNFNEDFYPVDFIRCPMDKDLKELIFDIADYDYIWGTGNPTPMVYIKDIIFTPEEMQIMGASQDTVKICKNGIEYIQFKAKDLIKKIREFDVVSLSVVGTVGVNNWGGKSTPQVMIKNWEVQNGEYTF